MKKIPSGQKILHTLKGQGEGKLMGKVYRTKQKHLQLLHRPIHQECCDETDFEVVPPEASKEIRETAIWKPIPKPNDSFEEEDDDDEEDWQEDINVNHHLLIDDQHPPHHPDEPASPNERDEDNESNTASSNDADDEE